MDKAQLKNRINFLKSFSKLKPKQKLSYMKKCPDEGIHTICECYYNLLRGNIKIDPKKKNSLRKSLTPIKLQVRKLTDGKTSVKIKRNLLSNPQVGKGIFATLAAIVIPAIISALASK